MIPWLSPGASIAPASCRDSLKKIDHGDTEGTGGAIFDGEGDFVQFFAGLIVREFVRMQPDIIRLRIVSKLNSFDCGSPQQHGLGYAVHAIHHAAAGRKNDGKAQIRPLYQADVLENTSPGQGLVVLGAERLVELADGSQWDVNARKVFGPRDEPINVPRQKPALGRAEVILLSHQGLDGFI